MIVALTHDYDVKETAKHAASGFEEVMTVNNEKKMSLPLCIIARLVIMITANAEALSSNPALQVTQINMFYTGSCRILEKLCKNKNFFTLLECVTK